MLKNLMSMLCFGSLVAAGAPVAAQSSADLAAIGKAIAANLDGLNGVPIVVLARYAPSRPDDTEEELALGVTLASAFAEARGIPLSEEEVGPTRCSWAPAPGDGALGLWAQFYPPEVRGDSIRVGLSTGCASARTNGMLVPFRQVHRFVLTRGDQGSWEVAERQLMSIT